MRHRFAIVVEDRKIDERLRRRSRRQRLVDIILVDDAAADRIGFGQAVTEQRFRFTHLRRKTPHMFGRTRRAAAGVALARRQIVVLAVRADENLIAHQRNADEIIDLLVLDEPHRLVRIPLGHQNELAPDRDALKEHRNFRGDVKQRGADQRRGLDVRHQPVLREQMDDARGLRHIVEDRLHHRMMARIGALRLAGRTGGEEDRRQIVAGESGQCRPGAARARDRGDRFVDRL